MSSQLLTEPRQFGVSIVICCYNSVPRLPQTLAHLAAQKVTQGQIPWEVIVVDNASTDQTATLALSLWSEDAPVPLRVVNEPQLGLIHARIRALEEARFELVSFIDDDNWACPQWVETVSELMSQHPDVGACGGATTAISKSPLPPWFERHAGSYVVGQQAAESGDITSTRGYLWGAGLTIRKSAWQQLLDAGFRPSLSGRKGLSLSAGEDSEICFALRLAGWRLWYDERLKLQHYLPPHRLEWSYLRRLHRGFGASLVVLGVYLQILQPSSRMFSRLRRKWLIETTGCFCLLMIELGKSYLSPSQSLEAEQALLQSEYYKGKLQALLGHRRDYAQMVERIQTLAKALEPVSQSPAAIAQNTLSSGSRVC